MHLVGRHLQSYNYWLLGVTNINKENKLINMRKIRALNHSLRRKYKLYSQLFDAEFRTVMVSDILLIFLLLFFLFPVRLGRVKLGQGVHQIARNKSMKIYGIGNLIFA